VVTFVEAIIARGFAYECNGSVYFHTAAFRAAGHDYPKLKVRIQCIMTAGARLRLHHR
jgi:cysteinyl-tRNA synthetase